MLSQRILGMAGLVVLLLAGWQPTTAQTVVLQERIETAGTVQRVSPGLIEITDDQGQRHEFKIQGNEDTGLALAGVQGLLRFPADVKITGTLPTATLTRGTLVRFPGQVNRLGRTEGSVVDLVLFDEGEQTPGIEVVQQAAAPGDFSECVIRGEVFSFRDQRLVVNVPPGDFVRNPRLAFRVDEQAVVRVESDDYRRASRVDRVELLANNPNYSDRFKALGIAMMTGVPGASFESVYGPVAREVSFEYDFFVRTLDIGYRTDLCAWQWGRKFQVVPTARHATARVQARYGWQASGIKLQSGQSYDYVAEGTWKIAADGDDLDADGRDDGRGRLVGVLMYDYQLGERFELGTRGTLIAPQDGDLYLRCQNDWNRIADHQGSVTIHLRRSP